MNVHLLHNMRKVDPKVRSRNSFACFRCGGGKITQKTTSCGPPLPGPKNEENILQSHRSHARRSQLRPLVPLVRRAKERGRKSICGTCCARSKFQKNMTGRRGKFCSQQRPAGGGTQSKHTTINQINNWIHILGASLWSAGGIGLLWLSQQHMPSAVILCVALHG